MVQPKLVRNLRSLIGSRGVVDDPDALITYNADGCVMDRHEPDVVVLPYTTEQVAAAIKLASESEVPIVPRGAGTGLSGGATPMRGGVIISSARMDKIVNIDISNRRALVQPGVINFELSQHLLPTGYHYAPDPSSQRSCTIGGGIANNCGGPHCLKYGVTTNHTLSLEIVLHDGRVLWTGDGISDAAGYDLTGVITGSEGTFCFVTQALVRLTRLPEAKRVVLAIFPDIMNASEVVSAIIGAGYLPTSLEVLDAIAIKAVNEAYRLGLPREAGALLLIEVDGVEDGLDDLLEEIMDICRQHAALELRPARTEEEQAQVWAARKNAFGSLGRLAPAYYLVDTVVPRTRLPYMMEQVRRLAHEYGMPTGNIFHAGDGNLHPVVMYNPREPEEVAKAHAIATEVMKLSIEQGGVISGEHGIGIEKQDYMSLLFSEADMQAMAAVYCVFNPKNRFNPAKIFPAGCDPVQLAMQRQQRLISAQGRLKLEQLGAALESIVGGEHLLQGEAAAPYSVQGQRPGCVVLPGTLEQLSAAMAACHQAGAVVVPWGGGTQQNLGYLSAPPDVVIVTRRLTAITKYEPRDLTIGVGAGITLAELEALLTENNQMLAIDAALPEQATIGGLVATATSGPRRPGYGTLRDLLLGVTVVEVDGTIIHSGGQVVKNVSGYDLVKLFHGSHGTLGIIAAVNLKTLPCPRTEATLLVLFDERKQAMALVQEMSMAQLMPTAVEYLDMATLDGHTALPGRCALAIRAEGLAAACARHMRDLHALAWCLLASAAEEMPGERQRSLWQHINNLAAVRDMPEDEALIRLVVLPNDLGAALDYLEEHTATHGLSCICSAHALHGIVYARVRGPAERLPALQHDLVARWKHSHVLTCSPHYRQHLPVWGAPPPGLDLMRAIKQTFDPANRLNPGRSIV